ncbi:hypothetical protein [Anatilimnocola floriformis]|uniref:hypothetical protein n=1 Tax=Anatilimnocola floriformis TaxID=2948575 RepID=UPI0020C29A60|nr:hypothetical protein [Anatilimnocola floriformis]
MRSNDDQERPTDRLVRQVESGLREDVRLYVYLMFHVVWSIAAYWAFRLGELWDGFLRGTTNPAYIGWSFGIFVFALLAFLWNRKIYGGWRF